MFRSTVVTSQIAPDPRDVRLQAAASNGFNHAMADLSAFDDETLIARSRDGDAAAVRALVGRHVDEAYRIAYRMVGHRAQAEDIAQDVLMRMLTYRAGWFSKASFRTWLRRAIVNRAIDAYRKRRPSTALDDAGEIPDRTPSQEHRLIAAESERHISAAVLALPERQRAAITLCFYENLALTEAANILKTSVGAVESLLHRAKTTLREQLTQNRAGAIRYAPSVKRTVS